MNQQSRRAPESFATASSRVSRLIHNSPRGPGDSIHEITRTYEQNQTNEVQLCAFCSCDFVDRPGVGTKTPAKTPVIEFLLRSYLPPGGVSDDNKSSVDATC